MIIESNRAERIAYLSYLLVCGRTLTTKDASTISDVSIRTAQRDLVDMSRVLPIYRDEEGYWRTMENHTDIFPHISPY